MKLELKHLASYLPYNLEGINHLKDNSTLGIKDEVFTYTNFYENKSIKEKFTYLSINSFLKEKYKPILFPLSSLTKEITINGEEFYPLEILGQLIDEDYKYLSDDEYGCIIGKDETWGFSHIDADGVINSYNLFYSEKKMGFFSTIYKDGNPDDIIDEIEHSSFELFQKLFEWKFDVFGLIDAGLAEPVTEDFNPYK